MVILKTTVLAFGLFGVTSFSISETPMPSLPTCKAYLVTQEQEFNSSKFKYSMNADGTYLKTSYDSWPERVFIHRECLKIK